MCTHDCFVGLNVFKTSLSPFVRLYGTLLLLCHTEYFSKMYFDSKCDPVLSDTGFFISNFCGSVFVLRKKLRSSDVAVQFDVKDAVKDLFS